MGRRSMRALCALSLLLACGIAGSVAAPASHASVGTGVVSPDSGLVDSQIVDLSWSGFLPNRPVYVRMCAAGATDETKCTSPNGDLDHFTAASDGTGAARYRLAEKDFGTFTCDDTHSCVIAMLEDPTNLTSGVLVPITFEKPPGACPNATQPPVSGEGATPAAFTMYAWEAAACKLPSPINVTYTNDNSYDGMAGFASSSPNANFAVTDVPMPSAEANQLANKHRTFAYAPVSLTGVGIAYNIVDRNGNQVRNLTLTPQIVEEIATGRLSSFDCPPEATDDQCVHIYGSDPVNWSIFLGRLSRSTVSSTTP